MSIYHCSLAQIGIRNLNQIQSLSEDTIGSLTGDDLTFSDYQKLKSGVTRLQQYQEYEEGLKMLEMEMLSHHKVGFVKNMYSWSVILGKALRKLDHACIMYTDFFSRQN